MNTPWAIKIKDLVMLELACVAISSLFLCKRSLRPKAQSDLSLVSGYRAVLQSSPVIVRLLWSEMTIEYGVEVAETLL
jgi:hypothetical protein